MMQRTISLALLMLAAGGCSSDDVTAPPQGVHTSVELSTDAVVSGQTFSLSVSAKNYGPKTAQITSSNGCTFAYRYVSEAGDRFVVPRFCPGIGSKLSLKPGETYEKDFVVSTMEPALADWPIAGDRLPPGRYRVQAGLFENEMLYAWAEAKIEVTP